MHWTYCSKDDIDLLASRKVKMAHCPASSSRRGLHKAPLGLIRDAGVEIVIGTDNMSEDMFQAMAFGSMSHRTGLGRVGEKRVSPTAQEVLDMVTVNAARSVAASHEIGALTVGMKADLTIIDLNTPALRPLIRMLSNVVNYGHPGTVHSVIVDGEFVMRDRKVLTIDEQALLQEAQAVTESVWKRMIAANPDIEPPAGELQWIGT